MLQCFHFNWTSLVKTIEVGKASSVKNLNTFPLPGRLATLSGAAHKIPIPMLALPTSCIGCDLANEDTNLCSLLMYSDIKYISMSIFNFISLNGLNTAASASSVTLPASEDCLRPALILSAQLNELTRAGFKPCTNPVMMSIVVSKGLGSMLPEELWLSRSPSFSIVYQQAAHAFRKKSCLFEELSGRHLCSQPPKQLVWEDLEGAIRLARFFTSFFYKLWSASSLCEYITGCWNIHVRAFALLRIGRGNNLVFCCKQVVAISPHSKERCWLVNVKES